MNKQSCGIVFIAISLVLDGRHSLRDLQNRVGEVQCRIQYLIKYKLMETFNLDFYTMILYGFQSCTCILPWITTRTSIVLFNFLMRQKNTSSFSRTQQNAVLVSQVWRFGTYYSLSNSFFRYKKKQGVKKVTFSKWFWRATLLLVVLVSTIDTSTRSQCRY